MSDILVYYSTTRGGLRRTGGLTTLQSLLALLRLREETVGVGAHTEHRPLPLVSRLSRDRAVLRSDWWRCNHVSRVLWWEGGGREGEGRLMTVAVKTVKTPS